jgi:hypothetical protein
VRCLKRRQQYLLRSKLANTFCGKTSRNFWSVVSSLCKSKSKINPVPVVDGVSGVNNIANLMASKLRSLLNTHSGISSDDLNVLLDSSLSDSQLSEVIVSDEDILSAIHSLQSGKTDFDHVSSNHLKFAAPSIADSLASLFSAFLRHGYMPKCFCDCVLISIPKSCKDPSSSDSYRPISLASCLSKVLERNILDQYSSFFVSHPLQFGFKPGFSTTLCTGVVKRIVSKYLHNGSSVFGCFHDASKAFDMVDHSKLFVMLKKGVFLLRSCDSYHPGIYCAQEMKVRWDSCLSWGFNVSNGVRQGGVLSPYLFAVYLDELLVEFV